MTSAASIAHGSAENQRPAAKALPSAREKHLRWRDAALALSIAHLSFIQAWYGLLIQNSFGYFNRIPVNRASLAALLINIFGLGLLLWIAGRWCRRINRPRLWIIVNIGACVLALVPLNFARTHFWNFTASKFSALLKEPVAIAVAIAVALAVIWFHRYAAKVVTTVYVILSPLLVFTVAKSAWWIAHPPTAPVEAVTPMAGLARTQPRVVWILLDELDQRVGFETRPSEVQMPELSRLYETCLRATNAFPPGGSTLYSLPALTIGEEVRYAQPISASALSLAPQTAAWGAVDDVFVRARALGFTTALVGWYHPYGRLLGRHLDRCEWGAYPPFEEERGLTVAEAILNQLCATFSQFQQRRLHIRLFQRLEAASLNFVKDSPTGLTFLHLPVPHHPGIYDPRRDQLTLWNYSRNAGYLHNLNLADRLFKKLRHAMEQDGTWQNTWVIVSSDHWWREAPQIDHRVPFIVKGPGTNDSALYSKPFNTVVTHDLVLAALKGELTNVSQVPSWLDAHRVEPPSGYKPNGQPF